MEGWQSATKKLIGSRLDYLMIYLGMPVKSRMTTEEHIIPKAAGIYEIVPTMDALFYSPFVATILLLSIGSGE